jgi:DNA-binding LacI/PurR family transcriptional regulator
MRDATIYDVADAAGVSVSTVSLAINNPSRVREVTRARIMDAVNELGFVPKHHAVTRARRGVGRVGVIAPFSSFPSFARRLNGVMRVARREGLEVTVFDQASGAEALLESLPLTHRVDGLIVMSQPVTERIVQRLIDQAIPTVLIELGHHRFSSVTIDNAEGGRMVAELLTRKGHKHLAYVGHAQTGDYMSQSALRLEGFRSGLPCAPDIRLVAHTHSAARTSALELLSQPDRPTAVFAHDDVLASGVLRAARDLGVAVPEELAVVGFDDSDVAEAIGLTTVRQPLEESGEVAAQTLLAQLVNPGASIRNTALALTVVERDTT